MRGRLQPLTAIKKALDVPRSRYGLFEEEKIPCPSQKITMLSWLTNQPIATTPTRLNGHQSPSKRECVSPLLEIGPRPQMLLFKTI